MIKISAAITSFNSEKTLKKCLQSLSFCDEIIVVDSLSTDKTLAIIEEFGCTLHQQEFLGYAKQKQLAIDLCNHDWVLLLDSDESIDAESQAEMTRWQNSKPQSDGYTLPRREYVFWQWSHPWVHKNRFLRLFKKSTSKMSSHKVHESVVCQGKVSKLEVAIDHFGETSIQKKLEKIHAYSSLSATEKYKNGKRVGLLKLIFSPGFYFFKQLVLRRQIFNGAAGWINACLNTYYAFLKHSKLYELQKNKN